MVRRVAERSDAVPVLAEVFREFGFAGASLAEITRWTGLGKGSLYHFFPGGKDEMARAVLDDVAAWFEANVFVPLRDTADPGKGIAHMFRATLAFFQSGRRICLLGTFALDDTRDRFASEIQAYFAAWIKSLAGALQRCGLSAARARDLAEDTVGGIQGALVLGRSQDDPAVFTRTVRRLQRRVTEACNG